MKLTRRGFLGKAATAVGVAATFPAIIPAPALGANGTVAPSNRITLGFVGLGGQGRVVNLQMFMAHPDAQVVALCDVHGKRLHSAHLLMQCYAPDPAYCDYRGCLTTPDWREIIARKDIDAVVISTPDHWHVPIAVAAARAGKDVFVEKPLSLTIREGRVLSDVVRNAKRVSVTASEARILSSFVRACELVRNGRIGKLHTIRVEVQSTIKDVVNPPIKSIPVPPDFDYNMWLGQAPEAPYQRERCHDSYNGIFDYAGGDITNMGAHLLDIAQMGNATDHTGPVSVEGQGVFAKDGLFNVAVKWDLAYEYANGVKMTFRSGENSIRFEGTDGWVQSGWGAVETSSREIAQAVIGPDEIHLRASGKEEQREQRDFLDAVKSREETYAPVETGHRTATICHIGNIALLTGRKLRWNPDTEQFLDDEEANRMLSRPMRAPWSLDA